jgi:hypothetical protein
VHSYMMTSRMRNSALATFSRVPAILNFMEPVLCNPDRQQEKFSKIFFKTVYYLPYSPRCPRNLANFDSHTSSRGGHWNTGANEGIEPAQTNAMKLELFDFSNFLTFTHSERKTIGYFRQQKIFGQVAMAYLPSPLRTDSPDLSGGGIPKKIDLQEQEFRLPVRVQFHESPTKRFQKLAFSTHHNSIDRFLRI